jgi:hypothetical protein
LASKNLPKPKNLTKQTKIINILSSFNKIKAKNFMKKSISKGGVMLFITSINLILLAVFLMMRNLALTLLFFALSFLWLYLAKKFFLDDEK